MGKSYVISSVVVTLRARYEDRRAVPVLSSTGFSASLIGGAATHSYMGVVHANERLPELLKRVQRSNKMKSRFNRAKVMVIDEVSMHDSVFFDTLSSIAMEARGNKEFMGGIQVVVTGDFLQLPPVDRAGNGVKMAFESFS